MKPQMFLEEDRKEEFRPFWSPSKESLIDHPGKRTEEVKQKSKERQRKEWEREN